MLGIQLDAPQLHIREVPQRRRETARSRLDVERAEELQSLTGRPIRLQIGRNRVEDRPAPERRVHSIRPERASVKRPGDEFPEWREVGKDRAPGIELVGRRVVHVGGDQDNVVNALPLDERQQLCELELASAGRTVAVRPRFVERLTILLAVTDDQTERLIAGNDLPRR